jgi:stringent starvation protein B
MVNVMNSSRPYLLRALNDWIQDNDMTPHIVVDASQKDVIVPTEFVSSGKIVLNISPNAVYGITIDNDFMSFSARFSGKAMDVIVPIHAILAVYAKENGQGMVFTDDNVKVNEPQSITKPESKPKAKTVERPMLTLVQ